ncbi:MAG TPA: TonB-dependent receptor, partial [Bacteroidia bacterium]
LNDRYNAAYINGAPLPSTESDRKAFSFDIFPSNLLDNLVIVKTATPELPADFAGGVIQINTKSIPEENFQTVAASTGYNTLTTNKEQYTYKGSKTDWLGFDNGARNIPNGLPETYDFKHNYTTPQKKAELAKFMPNEWALETQKFAPNYSFQYTIAQSFKAKEKPRNFGMICGVTYNRNNTFNTSIRREFQEDIDPTTNKYTQDFELKDRNYISNVLIGVLGNFSYKINDKHSISLKNMYSINTEDRVTMRDGIREYYNVIKTLEKSSVRWFTENKLYTSQLVGKHLLGKSIKLNWIGGFSNVDRNIPNLRRMTYTKASRKYDPTDPYEPDPVYEAAINITGTSPSTGGNFFYSRNKENMYSFVSDVAIPIEWKKIKLSTEIKAGGGYQRRVRDFDARFLGFTRYQIPGKTVFDKSLLVLPEEDIFAPENLGMLANGKGGFKLEEASKPNDSYDASSQLSSGFVMFDHRFRSWLRLIWGARMEHFNQRLGSFEDDGTPVVVDTSYSDILPSANAIFSLTEKQNIRASYYKTLSRPEFRELAPFGFYDFVTNFSIRGNQHLQRALINNYDLRYEFYPGRGQIVSVSGFYKTFKNAIEQINRADETRALTYQNVDKATNYGFEVELRMILGVILNKDSSKFLNNLTLFTNYAYIRSKVDVSNVKGSITTERALQGQSPYIVNAGIQYLDTDKGWGFSTAVNRIGRRIAIVGNTTEPDIWEQGRTVLDFQLSKAFLKKKTLEVKFNIRDALAQTQYFYQDTDKDKKLNIRKDNVMAETNFGTTFSFGVSFKF